MFLTFLSPPKDQAADIRFLNSVYGKNESMQKLTTMFNIFVGFFRGVVARFPKPETNTNASQRHKTLQIMAIELREGQAAAARQMIQEAAASSPMTAVPCVCAGAKSRLTSGQHLESNSRLTSLKISYKIPCPDLSLRSGRNTLFRWIFRSSILAGPTFVFS